MSWHIRFVPTTDIPDPKEKRVSLTQKATRANMAKKKNPDLRGGHSPPDSEMVGLPVIELRSSQFGQAGMLLR